MSQQIIIEPEECPIFIESADANPPLYHCSQYYYCTLEPLRHDGLASVVCTDIEGIQEVRLTALHYYLGGPYGEIEIHKSKNYLASLMAKKQRIPDDVILACAEFSIKLYDENLVHIVLIRPPSVMVFEGKEHKGFAIKWLLKRGFLRLVVDENATKSHKIMEGS